MKKYFIVILLLLINIISYAQVKSYFGGTLNVYASSGTSPEYTIQGFFNDTSGEYPLDSVAVGDIIYVSEGATCVRLRVDTINSSAGGILDADVYDVDTILLSPPSGIGALVRETGNIALPRYIPGLSETLLSCMRTHMTGKVDEEVANTPHPFSTVSPELEINAGELKLAQQGASVGDVWEWNGTSVVPRTPSRFEFVDTTLNITICNNLDTCDVLTLQGALQIATRKQAVYDSINLDTRINLIFRPNPDGSPIEITSGITITGGDYSTIFITSNWQDSIYTILHNTTENFLVTNNVSNLNITDIIVRDITGTSTPFGIRTDQSTIRFNNVELDSFRVNFDLIRSSIAMSNCVGNNAEFYGIWNRFSSVYGENITTTGNAFYGVYSRGYTAINLGDYSNNILANFACDRTGQMHISGNDLFPNDTLVTNPALSIIEGGIVSINYANFDSLSRPYANIPFNMVTDNGLILSDGAAYNFQESNTAGEPSAEDVRFYVNTDDANGEGGLRITDGSSSSYVIPSISSIPNDGDMIEYNSTTGRFDPVAPTSGATVVNTIVQAI